MIIKVLSGFTIDEITNLRTEPLSLTTLLVGGMTSQGVDRPPKSSEHPVLQGSGQVGVFTHKECMLHLLVQEPLLVLRGEALL